MRKGLLDDAFPRKLTPAEAKQLEKHLTEKPKDLTARFNLAFFYWRNQYFGKMAAQYRRLHARHVLWMIRNEPGSTGPHWPQFIVDRRMEPEGYRKAERAWLRQLRRHPGEPIILRNAAAFFTNQDRRRAFDITKQGARLEPNNAFWQSRLGQLYSLQVIGAGKRKRQKYARLSLEAYEAAREISGSLRQGDEISLAEAAYQAGKHDDAEKYAGKLLLWAIDHPEEAGHCSNAVHHGNTLLGRLALRARDVESAKAHLLASGDVSGSPVLGSFGPTMRLANDLLEVGEQETVLQYFDLCAKFWDSHADKLEVWAKQVRRGKMPDFGNNLDR